MCPVHIQACSSCRKDLEWMHKSLPTDSKLRSQDAWIILKATCIDDWTVISGCLNLALLCYCTYSFAIPRRHCFTYLYTFTYKCLSEWRRLNLRKNVKIKTDCLLTSGIVLNFASSYPHHTIMFCCVWMCLKQYPIFFIILQLHNWWM